MKWFKHFCNASDDPKISELEDHFGLEGYAVYWKTLEFIAVEMGDDSEPKIKYSGQKLKRKLSISVQKLTKIYQFLNEIQLLFVKKEGDYFFIECEKLLEIRDEYTRKKSKKSGHYPYNVAQEKDKETDKEKEQDKDNSISLPKRETVDYSQDFETFWKLGFQWHRRNEKKQKVFEKYRARRNSKFSVEDLLFIAERVMKNNQRQDNAEFRSGLFGAIETDIAAKQILDGERFSDAALKIGEHRKTGSKTVGAIKEILSGVGDPIEDPEVWSNY